MYKWARSELSVDALSILMTKHVRFGSLGCHRVANMRLVGRLPLILSHSRRCLVLAVVGAAVALAVVAWLIRPNPGVTPENYDRLRQGMTIEQVSTILGRPADKTGLECTEFGNLLPYHYWREGHTFIGMHFADDGTATYGYLVTQDERAGAESLKKGLGTDESILDRLRRWLGF
jgi:hypothetical protein